MIESVFDMSVCIPILIEHMYQNQLNITKIHTCFCIIWFLLTTSNFCVACVRIFVNEKEHYVSCGFKELIVTYEDFNTSFVTQVLAI